MTAVQRMYGGVSARDRRQLRQERLAEALLRVVAADGVAAVTVDRVCAAAGLTKRYFYESFANLDAALTTALDTAFAHLRQRMTDEVDAADPPERRARVIVEVLLDTLAGDPGLARLYVEAPGHAALRARREEAVADFTTLLLTPPLAIAGPTGDERTALAVRLVVGGTTDLVTAWLSGAVRADRADIVDTVVAAGLLAGGG